MAQLIVRDLDPDIVSALRARAARHGRSVEAEHREILREAVRPRRRRSTLKEWLLRMPDVAAGGDVARRRGRRRTVRL